MGVYRNNLAMPLYATLEQLKNANQIANVPPKLEDYVIDENWTFTTEEKKWWEQQKVESKVPITDQQQITSNL